MKAKEVAICAMMTALLIVVQIALGFVAGVELVTVFLLVFSYVFGKKNGTIVATAFSLVRCLIWGFYTDIIILYLVYFNLFAFFFGWLGGRKKEVGVWVCPILLTALISLTVYFAITGVKVSILYQQRISIMLWILCGILFAVLCLYAVLCILKKGKEGRELASLIALAVTFTVFFTLLNDVITPLYYGYNLDMTIAYFYGGFTAMLPQSICTAVSVFALFYPLRKIFEFVRKKV